MAAGGNRSSKKRTNLFKREENERSLRRGSQPMTLRLAKLIARSEAEDVILVIRVVLIHLVRRFGAFGLECDIVIGVMMRKNHIHMSVDAHQAQFMSAKRRTKRDRDRGKHAVCGEQKTQQT